VRREPPTCKPWLDHLVIECGITPVRFNSPIPPNTWCHYCGFLADSRDHIVPDSLDGSRHWWNLVPACKACNEAKDDRQACACLFCLRAMALWHLGFRRTGKSRREKKSGHPANVLELTDAS
jgi:hypothetical protein